MFVKEGSIFEEAQAIAKKNGNSEMTLEEINAEINAVRQKREE